MHRKLTILGLCLVAMASMAVAAGAAQAAPAKFTSSFSGSTTITSSRDTAKNAKPNHVFDAAGLSITCELSDLEGTASGTEQNEITMNANYTNCNFIGVTVNVNMNNCDYVFHADGSVDITNIVGKTCGGITFEGPGCKVVVPAQSGLKGITYTNLADGTITATPLVTKIKYTSSGFLCGTQSKENGEYTTGDTILTGEKSGGTEMVTISHDNAS
jgi:hypothetical protein